MNVKVEPHRCPQNHPCPVVRVCPTGAIRQRGYAAPEIDKSKCINCGRCIRYCGYGAIRSAW